MARYPHAIWRPGHSGGGYVGGPWRIVWHTTEGPSAEAAIAEYAKNNSWPHFTVSKHHVYQHIGTSVAARALRNLHPKHDDVETNRWHAIQIEFVAHAAHPKDPNVLIHAARLARWLERLYGIPKLWPNGYPKLASHGRDPGHHDRNRLNQCFP
jgi:hypothetical protein